MSSFYVQEASFETILAITVTEDGVYNIIKFLATSKIY